MDTNRQTQSVAEIEGHWQDPDFDSGLVARCKNYWNIPIGDLPDFMIATYLNQRFAIAEMQLEARRRIVLGQFDNSELYEGQLAEALAAGETK